MAETVICYRNQATNLVNLTTIQVGTDSNSDSNSLLRYCQMAMYSYGQLRLFGADAPQVLTEGINVGELQTVTR